VVSIARTFSIAAVAMGTACAPAGAALVQFTHTFANTTGSAQDFTFTATTPTSYSGETLFNIRGSLALNLIDLNGNGAFVSTNGNPLYAASVGLPPGGGTVVQTIWNQPWSFAVNSPYGNGVPPDQVFAVTNVAVAAQPLQPLVVTIRLSLSAQDMVTVTGTFEAVPVPTPGAMALLAAAGMSGFGRRRRR
jgi:hypothetical protein